MAALGSCLAADSQAPARARRLAAARCGQLPDDVLNVVLLLTSELVTNGVRHGVGDAYLDIEVAIDRVTVGVSDGSGGEVGVASKYRWPEGGHGLRLVEALSDRWGVETRTDTPTSASGLN